MSDLNTIDRLARIETNVERIALAVEKTLGDHEERLRAVERAHERLAGVVKLVTFLGAPATAGIIVFLARGL